MLALAAARRGKTPPGQMGAFCANQKPVMVVLTSENDDATGGLFPFVRAINSVFESNHPYNQSFSPEKRAYIAAEEQRSSLATIGHTRRYNTHELVGWQTYIDLPQADARRKLEEDKAEQRRQEIARINKEPPRSPEVVQNFAAVRAADESAWAIRRAHADKISARCAAGNQAFCWEPLKREGENDARTKEHERCARDLQADRNLAEVLAANANGGG